MTEASQPYNYEYPIDDLPSKDERLIKLGDEIKDAILMETPFDQNTVIHRILTGVNRERKVAIDERDQEIAALRDSNAMLKEIINQL